jgi:two-component system, chemotaxis family, chemotaxis protein CheY
MLAAPVAALPPPRCTGRRVTERAMAVDVSMPVLVVDDHHTMVSIIRKFLQQLGFSDIDEASDGAAAIARLRARRYGLVISDWNMAPMSGYELLKEVRADPSFGATRFIMITAESKTENVVAAKRAGVDNYIVKPFKLQTLQHKIAAVFPDQAPPPPQAA